MTESVNPAEVTTWVEDDDPEQHMGDDVTDEADDDA